MARDFPQKLDILRGFCYTDPIIPIKEGAMSHHHHHQPSPTSAARILVAFLLNLCFSVFELVGGIYTGSVAILSDALHDLGDAAGIGCSFFLERKSRKAPDATHTYGYARYSVLGGLITTLILILGSHGLPKL